MVTSNLETFVGEAGAFGELNLPLKNPGYLPPLRKTFLVR